MELRLAALGGALLETASPEMEQLLAYWRSLLKDDVLPDRRDLDPV
ncbi:MAG: hypothetical protein VX955_01510 [Pseudomonadota bacterium]|nr:hypothetical protein [Pseudomonadota bacterium]